MRPLLHSLGSRLALIALLPVLEISLIRYLVNINYLFPVGDFLFSILLSSAIFFFITDSADPLRLQCQQKIALLHLLSFPAFLILTLKMETWVHRVGWPAFAALWFAGLLLALGSSFFVLLNPAFLLAKVRRWRREALFGILAALSPIGTLSYWGFLARPTTLACTGLLRAAGFAMSPADTANVLFHPYFSLRIVPACSGMEGVYFFLFLYGITGMLTGRRYTPRALWVLLFLGITMMFALNIIRISLFFALSVILAERWGSGKEALNFLIWTFHSHIGWVLYFLAIGSFLWLMRRLQKKSNPEGIPTLSPRAE